MQDQTRGTIQMVAAMVISGTIGWFVVMAGEPVLTVVFWRCVFGAGALVILCAALGLLRVRLTQKQLLMAGLSGVALVLNWLLLFGSYSRASVSVATVVYNTQPFMLLCFGAVFFGERITVVKLGWLGLAFAGVVAIVLNRPDATYVSDDYLPGIAMALLAALGWATAAITTKALKGVPPQLIALIHVSVGSVMLAPFVLANGLPATPETWAVLASMGLIHTGLMYALLYAAIQSLPTSQQGALAFVYPVVTILVDVFAMGTRLQPVQGLGMAVILLAAAGMTLGWGQRRTRTVEASR
jgi:drug/metabolite transporter (DMT)-like permease